LRIRHTRQQALLQAVSHRSDTRSITLQGKAREFRGFSKSHDPGTFSVPGRNPRW